MLQELYYQVQYLGSRSEKWTAYQVSSKNLYGAQKRLVDFLTLNAQTDDWRAVRLVSCWRRWDESWSVKDVLEYRDNKKLAS